MDGVKQAATQVFVPGHFFNYEMGHDNEEETKFFQSTSEYGVSNDLNFTVFTLDVDETYKFH